MTHRLNLLSAALAIIVSNQAIADLYIYPVTQAPVSGQPGGSVGVVPAQPSGITITTQPVAGAQNGFRVTDTQSMTSSAAYVAPAQAPLVGGQAISHPAPPAPLIKIPGLFGKNVPLKNAVENLIPNRYSWSIVIEPGLEDKKVSWADAKTWQEAIKQVGISSGSNVSIDESSKRLLVTNSSNLAAQLAEPGTTVWTLKSGTSLRENLIKWGKIAHWEVQFVDTDINYPIDHSATLVGKFDGQGGVVDRLMLATKAREVPLKAVFYTGNRVVVIKEAGFKPAEATTPVGEEE